MNDLSHVATVLAEMLVAEPDSEVNIPTLHRELRKRIPNPCTYRELKDLLGDAGVQMVRSGIEVFAVGVALAQPGGGA